MEGVELELEYGEACKITTHFLLRTVLFFIIFIILYPPSLGCSGMGENNLGPWLLRNELPPHGCVQHPASP